MTNTVNIHALALKDATTLTPSTGVITVTQEYHVIAAESGTADTVDTISLGYTNLAVKGNSYRPLLLVYADAGDTITLSHGTGNLTLPGSHDVTLTGDTGYWLLWRGSAWYGLKAATSADNVNVDSITGATYDTVQDVLSLALSAGWVSGGEITDNGDGTVDVAAGTGFIRSSNSATAPLYSFDWDAAANVALGDGDATYVYLDYNSGTPIVSTATSGIEDNERDKFELAEIVREGTVLHITDHRHITGDAIGLMQRRIYDIFKIERATAQGGLILGELGTRNISVSGGYIWLKLIRKTIATIDTSASDTFDRYYRDGGSGWTKQSAQTQWDNTHYDDGTGVLGTMTAARYASQYFYIEADGGLVSLFGQAQYTTLTAAEEELPPTNLPVRISEHALLIGRVVFQKSDGTATAVQSPFNNTFAVSGVGGVTDHGALTGLADDDHAQYALLAGRSGGQTIIGGTGSGDDLHLQSTSNATKGNVVFDEFTGSGFIYHSSGFTVSGKHEVDNANVPTANDDINDGFRHGSIWIRAAAGVRTIYMTPHVSAGAATWRKIDNLFTPTTGTDWPDPDPTTYEEGLDDLAARTTVIEGSLTFPLILENGGTEADLSATGPGLVLQATSGAALSVAAMNGDAYTANEASNYTTSSVTFTAVDSTNFKPAITTHGRDVLIGFSGDIISTGNALVHFDIYVDDSAYMFGDDGHLHHVIIANQVQHVSFVVLVPTPSAGAHTYELHWKRVTNNLIMYAGAGTATHDTHPQFWAKEV